MSVISGIASTVVDSSMRDNVLTAAYALIGGGVFVVARMLLQEEESRAAQDNLSDRNIRKSTNFLVRVTRPFFTNYVVPIIRGKDFWDVSRRKYRRKLIAAGMKDEFTPDEFIGFKLFLILFFPVVGGLLQAGDFIDLPLVVILMSGGVGWFYPDIWMRGRMQQRQKEILRAMPFIVDLLALSTEAGLDFVGAIGKVVEKAKMSPLVEEFAQLLKEIKVGASRQEALREMAARIDMMQVNSFVAILISADQMGASIGKILRQQSDAIRTERLVRAEKAGVAAAQKVLIPLVCLIVPAVMIMIFAPMGLGLLYPSGK
ncbi:MAG: type II secretion system F family protein [Oligoflexia bacterium]|nr:type II secretion system F family protein [Oligoflexia bacterium]